MRAVLFAPPRMAQFLKAAINDGGMRLNQRCASLNPRHRLLSRANASDGDQRHRADVQSNGGDTRQRRADENDSIESAPFRLQ